MSETPKKSIKLEEVRGALAGHQRWGEKEMQARLDELEALLAAQVEFTERLRRGANAAIAHAAHINQHYCGDVPSEALSAWAEAQVVFNALSITPSPAQAVAAVVRGGEQVN